MGTNVQGTQRFYSLDTLRGLAALSIVLWHWQHFGSGEQPLQDILHLFYKHGARAVDLFFSLSGFIFFFLYSERVAANRISAREFFILRFSRLYPLHFVTLIVVTIAQFIAMKHIGQFVIYKENDAYHFLLNLLFASSVGLERGHSFNGPAWSISVEVFLYAVFFIGCRLISSRLLFCVLALIAGLATWKLYHPIANGLLFFFVGGCTYLVYRRLNNFNAMPITIVAIAAWLATLIQTRYGVVHLPVAAGVLWGAFVLFPVSILVLALHEDNLPGKRLALLGDISYSSYLLHFPLQLAFMGAASLLGFSSAVYSSPLTLLLFFAILVALSAASFRFLERPSQEFIRAALRRDV